MHNCKENINQINKENINKFISNIKKYNRHNAFQETAISYLIHNSESGEILQAQKLFNLFDKNNEGKINFDVFFEQMEKLSGEKLEIIEVEKIFENIDTNRNNYIELEEFIKAAVGKKIFLEE